MKIILNDNVPLPGKLDIPVYFNHHYCDIQDYGQLFQVEGWENNEIYFFTKGVIEHQTFISLPRSPFGGIINSSKAGKHDFEKFVEELKHPLKEKNVKQVVFNNPVELIYPEFVPSKWFLEVGFTQQFCELNQHVNLSTINIHEMQHRRYRKAVNDVLEFRKIDLTTECERLHDFISKARNQQGLEINIDFERFRKLSFAKDLGYEGWLVEKDGTWMAALFIARVSNNIAYYYLPASLKEYNEISPMVFLLFNLYEILKERKVKILDMGISSIKGTEQSSLAKFKKRMGAEMHNRGRYILEI